MADPDPTENLAAWAAVLRAEGDKDTADTIDLQIAAGARGAVGMSDAPLPRALAQARSAEAHGRYALAARHYTVAAQLLAGSGAARGTAQAIEVVNDVARCRLTAGDHLGALAAYAGLLRTLRQVYGDDDALVAVTRHQLDVCQTAIRWCRNTLRLQAHLDGFNPQRHERAQVHASVAGASRRGANLPKKHPPGPWPLQEQHPHN